MNRATRDAFLIALHGLAHGTDDYQEIQLIAERVGLDQEGAVSIARYWHQQGAAEMRGTFAIRLTAHGINIVEEAVARAQKDVDLDPILEALAGMPEEWRADAVMEAAKAIEGYRVRKIGFGSGGSA